MKRLYAQIVDEIRSKGLRVIHRRLKRYYGVFYNHKNTIVIDSAIRGKLIGCITLYHEFNHALDFRHNRHKKFYHVHMSQLNMPNSKKRELIWKVEWGCYHYAFTRLKKYGIKKRDHVYLKKCWVKKNILPIWVSLY
jgi:hypothetical protein